MITTKYLTIDMVHSGVPAVVDVMQGDEGTRQVSVSFFAAGVPWEPPSDATASVSFRKPDNTSGWYDQLADGSVACTVTGNNVTAVLAPEVTQISGDVFASIIFRDENMRQIGAFPFVIHVIANPAAGGQISNSYYNVTTLQQINDALQDLASKPSTITGSGAPTTETVGEIGQLYMDTDTAYLYKCTNMLNDSEYIWILVSSPLIVTLSDSKKVANNDARQIFEHVRNGGTALLYDGDCCLSLAHCDEISAYFHTRYDDYVDYGYSINSEARVAEYVINPVSIDLFNQAIGDISTALDHIIALQEALIGS